MTRRTRLAVLAALAIGATAVLALWGRPAPAPDPTRPMATDAPSRSADDASESERVARLFSGEAALAHVRTQVAFGPRIPGSDGQRAMRAWLRDTLAALGARVNEQAFRYVAPHDPGVRFDGVNVVAQFQPDRRARIMLAAHYDTRAVADEDPDPAKRDQPVPGANDGASGVAVLVELARLLSEHPLPGEAGVDLVFFDVEDAGEQMSDAEAARLARGGYAAEPRVPFAIGSRAFVEANPAYRPQWGVLLDLVGDRRLRIPREGYSQRYAGPVLDRVFASARAVGATAFVDAPGPPIEDDHVAFLQAGIPVVDLIHAPFPDTWHTTADTPENVSAESLRQVGAAVAHLVWGG